MSCSMKRRVSECVAGGEATYTVGTMPADEFGIVAPEELCDVVVRACGDSRRGTLSRRDRTL